MKKLFLCFGFVVAFVFTALACGQVETAPSYLILDINPSISFIINEDDEIESFNLLNEDAEIVAGDVDFIGMSTDDAVELFLMTAVELGYIDVTRDDNVVFVTLVNEDEDESDRIGERIRAHVEGFMVRHRIGAVVVDSGMSPAEFNELAEGYGIHPGKLRIAMAASEADDTLTLDDAVEMTVKELMAIVREAHTADMAEFRLERQARVREMHEALRETVRERVEAHMADLDEMPRSHVEARIRAALDRFDDEDRAAWHTAYRQRQEARKSIFDNDDEE